LPKLGIQADPLVRICTLKSDTGAYRKIHHDS
jgi:hypothetical protein